MRQQANLFSSVLFLIAAVKLSYCGLNWKETYIRIRHENRIKRSSNGPGNGIRMSLQIDNQDVNAYLQETKSEFVTDELEVGEERKRIMKSIFYKGEVTGFKDSYVSGALIDDSFEGKIYLNNTVYSVEPKQRYVSNVNCSHISIVHTLADATENFKQRMRRSAHPQQPLCSTDDVRKEMDRTTTIVFNKKWSHRKPRSIPRSDFSNFPHNLSCCYLYVRTDPFLWAEIFKKEGQKDERKTELYILSMLNRAVNGANEIFRSVPFQHGNVSYKGFQLKIKRIKIMRPEDCSDKQSRSYRFCERYMDVLSFLHAHSEEDFSEYCLAYTFTARDFDGGTLGLAWSGKTDSNRIGGICERAMSQCKRYRGLNSGIVTVINYASRISMLMLELTFTHEVAHNLGAEHDPVKGVCAPGPDQGGFFLMYPRAMSTNDKNNNRFSSCSLEDLGKMMVALVHDELAHKPNCLSECVDEFCGNRLTEEGEDCDCGFEEDCQKINDNCCEPADREPSRRCKLKAGAFCSRSQGPCCGIDCKPEPPETLCYMASPDECINDVYCSGTSPFCPMSDSKFFKPDRIFCNNYTGICQNGDCTGSICELFGLKQCFLEGDLRSKDMELKMKMCHLACLVTNYYQVDDKKNSKTNSMNAKQNVCVDTFSDPMFINYETKKIGFKLRKGSSCAGMAGYCDVFDVCRPVDNEGPLFRIRKMFFSREKILSYRDLAKNYWWALLLSCCVLVLAMASLLKICSVHTKSSNPYLEKKTPHRSFLK